MPTHDLMVYVAGEFLSDLFKRSEPKRCMFDLEGKCINPPVDGHFIQGGLLKLIQDSKQRVISFYNLEATHLRELNVEYALNRPIKPDAAARRQFLCGEHEQYFWPLENPGPDWDNPEHEARLVYRTCLINRYVKEWAIEFASRVPWLSDLLVRQRRQLSLATPLESATRDYLNRTDQGHLRHALARIEVKPRIAATGVIIDPPVGTHFRDLRDNRVIPTGSSPIAITILPGKREQVALISYAITGLMHAKQLLTQLEVHNGSIGTAMLSKKVLEEMEFIHISPRFWTSLDGRKRESIRRYWKESIGASERDIRISPSSVDLFATPSQKGNYH